jgi:hypothetical protein
LVGTGGSASPSVAASEPDERAADDAPVLRMSMFSLISSKVIGSMV